MIRPDERQLREAIDEVRSICDDLEHGILDRSRPDGKRWSLTAFELFARARVRSRDKLPAPDRGRRAIGSHSDPTATQAEARVEDKDADLEHFKAMLVRLQLMVVNGRYAVKELDEATPEQQRPDRPNLDCCRVCSRPGKPEPVYRGSRDASERCRWCYDFWVLWKVDAPESILKLRREGKRITENIIRLELDEEMVG